ncbi:sensor histidine kinase, partial [Cryobacterium roopkundense]
LTGDDVTVAFSLGGDTVYGRVEPTPRAGKPSGPHASPPPGAVITQRGNEVAVTQTVAGGTLTLSASEAGIDQTLSQLRTIEIVAAAATLLVTGLLLTGVVGVALRPLTRMTALAVGIAHGDRGGRLRPSNPRTEIGRTAAAIDDMLQALEAAETTARDAAHDAADAEERMRRLLADVSHELRTPEAGLQASAETLLRTNPARAERERLTVGMIQQTHRAARLVNDLLLIERLDQGGEQRMPEPVNLSTLAERVVAEQRLLAEGRSISLSAQREVWVHGDAERLGQIVTNLLDNARHATDADGTISVVLRVRDGSVQLEVGDSGAGVAPADRERIFERFVRLDPARSGSRGGSGLGLPIARALARAHGGTLAYGLPGGFTLTLPSGTPPA